LRNDPEEFGAAMLARVLRLPAGQPLQDAAAVVVFITAENLRGIADARVVLNEGDQFRQQIQPRRPQRPQPLQQQRFAAE